MQLRDYQIAAVTDILSDELNVCLVSPTGSGKTTMGAELAARLGGRICWVAHREELVAQAKATLDRAFNAHGWGGPQELVVTTIQSLKPYDCDWLFIDECPHYAADTWSDITTTIKHKRRIGLTAYPTRADGRGLHGLFDRLYVAAQYSQLIALGHICDCKIFGGPDLAGGLAMDPLKAWKLHGSKRLTLAYAPSVEQARIWAEQFQAAGVRSDYVTAEDAPLERKAKLAAFARGEITVLWNVHILTEGVDIPQVSCILLARNVDSISLYMQIVGRGLRVHPCKADCVLIDLAGTYKKPGFGSPTEDRVYSLTGKAIRRANVLKLRQCIACGGVCKSWVGKCPICGFVTERRSLPVQVFDEELEQVFDGRETVQHAKDAALARMRAQQVAEGRPLWWLVKTYKSQFGINPIIRDATPEEKAAEWARVKAIASVKRFRIGWAVAQYKARFGCMPDGMSWGQVRG